MTDSVELLRTALAALKDAGVLRAQVTFPDEMTLSVEFPVDMSALMEVPAGLPPSPGAWKGPSALDQPFEDEPK